MTTINFVDEYDVVFNWNSVTAPQPLCTAMVQYAVSPNGMDSRFEYQFSQECIV